MNYAPIHHDDRYVGPEIAGPRCHWKTSPPLYSPPGETLWIGGDVLNMKIFNTLLAITVGCAMGFSNDAYSQSGGSSLPYARGDMAALTASVDHPLAPGATFSDAQGHEVGLQALKGKLLLVNLWATWCGGCVREMPSLAKLQAFYRGRISVIPISIDGLPDREKARAFMSKIGTLPFYQSPQTSITSFAKSLQPPITFYPSTIIYDAKGHELARLTGATADWNDSDAHVVVDRLLSGT